MSRQVKIINMDQYEGRGRLDWWANSSTLLGSAEVTVVITASDTEWNARAQLISEDDDERESDGGGGNQRDRAREHHRIH